MRWPVRMRRETGLEGFDEALGVSNPGAGFTGTRGRIVPQFVVQRLDQPDAVAQGCV
jgi:hypothetical protein